VISKAALHKNPFVGLFFKANNSVVFGPRMAEGKLRSTMETALGVPFEPLSVAQSDLVGLFAAMNSSGCILPFFAEPEEAARVKKLGLNVALASTHYACGNSILCNDHAALIHPGIPRAEAASIADALGVEAIPFDSLTKIPTVGAINVVTNRGLLAYNDMPQVELKKLEKLFKVRGNVGTCNLGVPYNGMGVVANDKGAVVGDKTSGFEVQRIYESLMGDEE
jgi:translation initiation factor 6